MVAWWSTNSSIALWLNKCGAIQLTSFGSPLLKETTLALGNCRGKFFNFVP